MNIEGTKIVVYYSPDGANTYSITDDDGLKIHIEDDWIGVERNGKVTMINTKKVYLFKIE